MKRLITISAFVALSFLSIGGCVTTQTYVTPDNAKIAATVVCTGTLTVAVKEADRPVVAAYIYGVAAGVRSLAGGTVPSPEQLKTTVALFTKNAEVGQWSVLSTSIQGIYSGLYAQLQGNPKLSAQYLEAIAEGCELAAEPFLAHATPSPTP